MTTKSKRRKERRARETKNADGTTLTPQEEKKAKRAVAEALLEALSLGTLTPART